jgi:hypothetical protein
MDRGVLTERFRVRVPIQQSLHPPHRRAGGGCNFPLFRLRDESFVDRVAPTANAKIYNMYYSV